MGSEEGWFAELSDRHFVEVGRAVTEWGELEMLLYQYLEQSVPAHDLYRFLAKHFWNFGARCDLLAELVSSRVDNKERVDDLVRSLSEAKNLNKKRNLLAHNPMQFWIDDAEKRIVGGVVDSRTGSSADFDLDAVKEFIDAAHEVRFKIMRAMIKATGHHA